MVFLPYAAATAIFFIIMGYALLGNSEASVKSSPNSRLDEVLNTSGGAPSPIRNASGQHNENMKRRLQEAEKRAEEGAEKASLAQRLTMAGFKPSAKGFYIASTISAIIFTALAFLISPSPFIWLCAFIIGGLGMPRLFLKIAISRRRNKFMEEMPDALEAIVRSIQSGLPIIEAIGIIAREYEGPIAQEFSQAFDEQKMGLTLGESMKRLTERMPTAEMRMLSMAVNIQMQTGGSLAETLINLSNVIRGRERLARKVRAVSSEAKSSALIMACLPLFIMGALGAINPEYVGLLWTNGTGKMLSAFCVFWMSLGVLVMWKMVNFKV